MKSTEKSFLELFLKHHSKEIPWTQKISKINSELILDLNLKYRVQNV